MSWFSKKEDISLENAEEYIRKHSCLWRHYSTEAVQDCLKGTIGSDGHIADISDRQVEGIVEKIRREKVR